MTIQEYEVKRIEPFSLGKVSAALSFLIGLLMGLIYLPFATFMMTGGLGIGQGSILALLGTFLGGFILTVFLAVVYAGVGFAFGVFYGYVYNYISEKVGGLEMVMDIEG